MNESDLKLLDGLRALAADGLREAPVAVEERVLGEFRRRTRTRRRNLGMAVGAGAIAAGVAIAVMLWIRPAPVSSTPASFTPTTARLDSQEAALPSDSDDVAASFYRLPDADYLPPMESATVVRVELPMSSVRLMGWPVSEERAGEGIEADVLLGQDGLARGVRFVE
jgi:hypothetical protein